jgi:hypothetical protein
VALWAPATARAQWDIEPETSPAPAAVAPSTQSERPDPLKVIQLSFGSLAASLTLVLIAQRKLRFIKTRVYR